jgi:hypothetical protein
MAYVFAAGFNAVIERPRGNAVYVELCPRIEWMGDGTAEGGLSRPGASTLCATSRFAVGAPSPKPGDRASTSTGTA